ncbi:MAG: aminotransferase class I/II-fold pyridoxal phosphate-dependent enzyme [Candidatus Lokiarchaeota archaeon]|nr:aminotransferase class I/II-fold pyridoxal phosphate-dependent enzyme [Candidatus Lokiarchaeota archaeon]
MAFKDQEKIREKYPEWPQYDEEDIKAVSDVVKSGKWWIGAPAVHIGENGWKFQEEFGEMQESKYTFACTNGTHAIEIALSALDIGLGDEVICPVTSFVATASAIVATNAVPIFCDVHPETFNIDHRKIEELITERTKAIVPVHLGGMPCQMDEIVKIAEKHNLRVVEDSAHSHGSRFKGKRLGNWGDVGTFSMQASKVLTSGEGGCVICNDDDVADAIYSYLDAGRKPGEYFYDHYVYGSNYRIPELCAALLRTQLKKFPAQHKKRNENGPYLRDILDEIDGITCQKRSNDVDECGYYVFPVKFDPDKFGGITKKEFYQYLNDHGIPTDDDYPPMHQLGLFKNVKLKKGIDYSNANWGGLKSDDKFWPVAVDVFNHSFEFPQELLLGTKPQMDFIAETIRNLQKERL